MINGYQAALIVNKPRKLTKKWAQCVVNCHQNRNLDEINLDNTELNAVDIGTTTRIRLTVDHTVTGLPKCWFIKLPSLSWRAKAITALPRLLPTEARFYNELAGQIPLTIPKLIVGQSCFGLGSTLVMQDVTEIGAIPGKAGDALSAEQAMLVAGELAKLHATFYDKAKDNNLRWLDGSIRRLEGALGTALAVPLMKRGLRLAGDNIQESLHAPALQYARKRKQVMQFLNTDKPTLVHHDCHPGNLFWQGSKPGFLDWQMVRIGEGVSDISYFMATALVPEVRRACELDVLKRYHESIQILGRIQSDFDTLLNRYRVHLAYPFEAMIVTLAVGGLMQEAANLEMIRRSALAVVDHKSFDLLPIKA